MIVLDNLVGGKKILNEFLSKDAIFYEGDLRNAHACKNALKGVDLVYHLAAHAAEGQSVYIPKFNASTNIMGSIVLLEKAINQGIIDFVFTSSVAAYGEGCSLPIKEDCPLKPEDPYGITKATFENYLRVYHELNAINPFIVRFFNVYGPWQRMTDPFRGVIPIFINRILKNKPPLIFGDGKQVRAFTYIDDIINPLIDLPKKKKLINSPVNIGSEEVRSVRQVAEALLIFMDKEKLGIEFAKERKSDAKYVYCDISKAKKLLNYKPKIDLTSGLCKTISWALEQGPQKFSYKGVSEIEKLKHSVYKNKSI